MLKLIIFVLNYLTILFYTKTIIHLKACLHGGGGPQVSEVRDGPVENLSGGGGAGEVQKKNSRKGKLNEKNSCKPFNPKKYSCYGLKKVHTRNLITKKNSCGSKIPLPPHNFSNGPSLTRLSR